MAGSKPTARTAMDKRPLSADCPARWRGVRRLKRQPPGSARGAVRRHGAGARGLRRRRAARTRAMAYSVMPPVTSSTTPLMYEASSLARKA